MRRFAISLLALATVLVMAQRGFAEPPSAGVPGQAAALTKQPPAHPASASSSDAAASADVGRGEDFVPVGFGWG
ncbi:hypothetical protein [Rhodopila sp.]|uniref:hypothetical protein n=1 Tax=Rhodopila sp. TaxID=2480087 RepID=UPI003D0B71C0